MPVLGQGIMPSGAAGQELQYVTRRAFVPKMVVQIYNSSPTIAAFLANSQPAAGGVSAVTVPVQGNSFVSSQWTNYSGDFLKPGVVTAAQNAEFNLKALVTPIPFQGFEGVVQQDYDIIPLLEARMNDATNNSIDVLSSALFNNSSDQNQLIGLPGAIDDGTNLVTYGNINRTTNSFWKAKTYAAGSVNPTRALIMQYITGTVKSCGEMPDFGIMGPGTWQQLANDFLSVESFQIRPGETNVGVQGGVHSGFQALMVAGVPIFMDPYMPEGTMYLLNTNYGAMYLDPAIAFTFSGFESTIPNYQVGYIGLVMSLLEFVVVKPKAFTRVTGLNYISI